MGCSSSHAAASTITDNPAAEGASCKDIAKEEAKGEAEDTAGEVIEDKMEESQEKIGDALAQVQMEEIKDALAQVAERIPNPDAGSIKGTGGFRQLVSMFDGSDLKVSVQGVVEFAVRVFFSVAIRVSFFIPFIVDLSSTVHRPTSISEGVHMSE